MISKYVVLFILLVVTFILGMLVIPLIVKLSNELHLYDLPDNRKVHHMPIPRLGGMAFLPIITVGISAALIIMIRLNFPMEVLWEGSNIQHFLAYLDGVLMLYFTGLYDDVSMLSYRVKFIVQIIAASFLCLSGLWIADFAHVCFIDAIPYWIGMPFTVLFVVYITNAINLIDGIDGLSSGLSIIALIVLACLNLISDNYVWAMLCIAYLGVVASFFYFNVVSKKTKIFMGDAGSLTLGFTLAFLVLHFWQRNPVWNDAQHNIGIIAISTLVIPAFDVVRVMMSRIRDHRNPFLPDKNHIHHKLMRAGLSGKMTMIVILFLSCLFITSNYLVAAFLSQTLMIVMDVVLFCLTHFIINIFISRREHREGIKWSRIF